MYDLGNFSLKDMTTLGMALRNLGEGANSMEEAANRIVRHIYDNFVDPFSNTKALALARFFITHPYGKFDAELREIARSVLKAEVLSDQVRCLTLLATAGIEPEWNDRRLSTGHRAIPLLSEELLVQFPMISQLAKQLGLETNALLKPDSQLIVDLAQTAFNVFFVPEALGSSFIPVQEAFVIPFGVKSVLGFGSMLPSGDLAVIILFARVPINQATANMFKPLALNVKIAVLPFVEKIFG